MQRKNLCVLVCFLIWGLCTCQLANHGRSPSRLPPDLQRILNGNVVQHNSGNPPLQVEDITSDMYRGGGMYQSASARSGGMYQAGGRLQRPRGGRRHRPRGNRRQRPCRRRRYWGC